MVKATQIKVRKHYNNDLYDTKYITVMCKSNKDDEGDPAIEGQPEMEEEAKCSRPAKCVLFFFNLLIWLGSGALLGLGIYALVDSPYSLGLTDGNILISLSIIIIIVGGIGFIISFVGCCGAMTENKCLVVTYVAVLGILLTIILCGVILAFIFKDSLQDQAKMRMINTMRRYSPNQRDGSENVVQAWDAMQKKIMCCGVNNYRDWHNYSDYYRQPNLPPTCCKLFNGQEPTSCSSTRNFNDYYSGETDGCYYRIIATFEKYTPAVAGVAAGVALVMAIGLCLGCITCHRL